MKNIILALLFSLPVLAQDYILDKDTGKALPSFIGQLRLVQGKVFKRAQGKLTEVYSGERFFEGNALVTGKDARAKMMMVDETIVSLGPEGEILFKKFSFKDKENRNCEYELIKGQLRGNIPQKLKTGSISFKTKFSTMGIRGTQILVNHQKLPNVEISEFALIEGSAQLQFNEADFTELAPAQHVVIIGNRDGKSARDVGKISEEAFKELEAKIMNEEKEFRPFLPLVKLTDIAPSSPLRALTEEQGQVLKKSEDYSKGSKTPKNWRESLKKLNEQLNKNQN